MNKDDILKDFDTLAEAKRKGAVNLKLCLGFALLVVVLVLAWGLTVNFRHWTRWSWSSVPANT